MYCSKCGSEIPENDKFCPNCGESVTTVKAPVTDHTDGFCEEDIERTKYLAAICYLGVLFMILGLVIEPDSKFIRYHINQALLIAVLSIACGIVCIIPVLGWLAGAIGTVAGIVFTIMGIVRALNGRAEDLPVIGNHVIIHCD